MLILGSTLQPHQRRVSDRSYTRRGWIGSFALHLGAALALVVGLIWFVPQPQGMSGQVALAATTRPADANPPILTLPPFDPVGPTVADLAAAEIERLSAEAIPPKLHAELLDESLPPHPELAGGHWVAARVQGEIARVEQLPPEDQLARLKSLTGQLNRISSADSVAAVTGRLAALLGAEDRAQQPAAEPVAGEFDFETAQVHDVRRNEREAGQFEYVAILLDAEGRTLETMLSPVEGEQLFKVMELVKANPLLERIYRGVVMSLLDKMLKVSPQESTSSP